MEQSTPFSAPKRSTESSEYKPLKNLPEHFEGFAETAGDLRDKATPVLREILKLTDRMSLRGAATIPDLN